MALILALILDFKKNILFNSRETLNLEVFMAKVIRINAIISSAHADTDLTEDEFYNKFIDFIESNDWICGGGITEEEDNDE